MIELNNIWPEWKIEKRIGRGAYGEVYKAVRNDYGIETYSAIKIISIPADNCEVDELFYEGLTLDDARVYLKSVVDECVSEIRLMESLKDNLNVVNIEDYKVIPKEEGLGWDIFIRMELLTPLNEFLCDKELTEKEVIKLGIDICNVLDTCQKKNIIHRDIKPENIMVNSFGDFKLGDFGIARNLENMTMSLSRKGTMNYMSPEVANGSADYDIRVDIYSLGLVLYKLMNGNKMPFLESDKQLLSPGERKLATERRLKGEQLPKPCNASEKVAKVILKACDANPNNRYRKPSEMKAELMKIMTHRDEPKEENVIIEVPQEKPKKVKNKRKDNIIIFIAIILLIAIETVFYFLNKNDNNTADIEPSFEAVEEIEEVEYEIDLYKENQTIDYEINRKIVADAKKKYSELTGGNPNYYKDITYYDVIKGDYSEYELYLIAIDMINHGEYEKAGKFIAHVLKNEEFVDTFLNPGERGTDSTAWDYRTGEFYDFINVTFSGTNTTRMFYKEFNDKWTLVEVTITGTRYKGELAYYEIRYDREGNLVHHRIATHMNGENYYDVSEYDGLIGNDKIIREAAQLMEADEYKEAKEKLSKISKNSYAADLINVCDFEIMYKDRSECSFEKLEKLMSDSVFVDNYFGEIVFENDYNGKNEISYERVTTMIDEYRLVRMVYDKYTNELMEIILDGDDYYLNNK
ncbi:MAG: serine/threonine protein kinase [Firmicutes bacterium]|nr:serine/threonine protein kinase [Candidatus Colivicinus equi]